MLNKSLRFKINAAIFITCMIIVAIFWSLLYPFEVNRRNARFEEIGTLLDTVFQQKRDELANEVFADQRLAPGAHARRDAEGQRNRHSLCLRPGRKSRPLH